MSEAVMIFVLVGFLAMVFVQGGGRVGSGKFVAPIKNVEVSDFASCAAAGYAVLESMPRQCRSGDGRIYVEAAQTGEGGWDGDSGPPL